MDLHKVFGTSGEWLSAEGPRSDMVISSRIRLARNLAGHRFSSRMDEEEMDTVLQEVRDALNTIPAGASLRWFDLEGLSALERHLLLERHLISREQESADGPRAVAFDESERISIMVNEEDHLRLQSLRSGLQLQQAYADLDQLDNDLSTTLDFAFDQELGYLTACPTNVGTGLRVSVMLHLPALVMTRHIEKAFRAIHDLRLAVRGLYGEGTEAFGELYQISNQITIGRTEQDLIHDLEAMIESILTYEQRARERMVENERLRLEDRVWRAFSVLRHARVLNSEEAMKHLSQTRLGVCMGILPQIPMADLNRIFALIQPAHLQHREGRELSSNERDEIRARLIREHFSQIDAL